MDRFLVSIPSCMTSAPFSARSVVYQTAFDDRSPANQCGLRLYKENDPFLPYAQKIALADKNLIAPIDLAQNVFEETFVPINEAIGDKRLNALKQLGYAHEAAGLMSGHSIDKMLTSLRKNNNAIETCAILKSLGIDGVYSEFKAFLINPDSVEKIDAPNFVANDAADLSTDSRKETTTPPIPQSWEIIKRDYRRASKNLAGKGSLYVYRLEGPGGNVLYEKQARSDAATIEEFIMHRLGEALGVRLGACELFAPNGDPVLVTEAAPGIPYLDLWKKVPPGQRYTMEKRLEEEAVKLLALGHSDFHRANANADARDVSVVEMGGAGRYNGKGTRQTFNRNYIGFYDKSEESVLPPIRVPSVLDFYHKIVLLDGLKERLPEAKIATKESVSRIKELAVGTTAHNRKTLNQEILGVLPGRIETLKREFESKQTRLQETRQALKPYGRGFIQVPGW